MKKSFGDTLAFVLNLGFILIITYGLLLVGHPLGLLFALVLVGFGIMEIWYRICWYQSDKRINRYVESGFREW